MCLWASEMGEQVEALVAKAEHLSWIPEVPTVEEGTDAHKLCVHAHTLAKNT